MDNNGIIVLNDVIEELLNKESSTRSGIKVSLEECERKNGKNGRWIQLLDDDNEPNDMTEEETLSPLRFFFDDNITIKDDVGNEYEVIRGNESELQLCLRLKNETKDKRGLYPKGSKLSVEVNTRQLILQRNAVDTLRKRPLIDHKPLLQLFNPKKKFDWDYIDLDEVDKWYVLTDDRREGCEEQRRFVKKSLSTPDFAFLAGPPGSGKTTVILELISQLISKKKRVLLCGSTHVAIDNVLERIEHDGLTKKLDIIALRIGDTNRISEKVAHFQIDNVLGDVPSEYHHLVRESANLVCGTTMGILRHPDFGINDDEPIKPDFDYLIIDESSKTTFQEFLVPALHAKRWILAGDVMQLSPYTEREQIVTNIEQISTYKNGRLEASHQQAIYILHRIEKLRLSGDFIIPVSKEELAKIEEEFNSGRAKNILEKGCKIKFVNDRNKRSFSPLILSSYNIIFIDKNIIDEISLPETHTFLWRNIPDKWFMSEHMYNYRALYHKIKKPNCEAVKDKPNKMDDDIELNVEWISKMLYEKSWAEEVAWRVDREHQLRLLKGSQKRGYGKQIEELMPSVDRGLWIYAVNKIASITFPSILEALECGIFTKNKDQEEGPTIASGFPKELLRERREMLIYQHRMHPDISRFSRERFYSFNRERALIDYNLLERDWDYKKYAHRFEWIDVNGSNVYRGVNLKEAEKMIEELKDFVEFADSNKNSKNWTVACLTFYRGQERKLRELLQKESNTKNNTNFKLGGKVSITLCTVDRFQGQEADVVFLSMVQNKRVGFMDCPNRINVALTRARFQNVIIGDWSFFNKQRHSYDLSDLAYYSKERELRPKEDKRMYDKPQKR